MKIAKEPKHKPSVCLWPINRLFCWRSSSRFHSKHQENSRKKTMGQYAACHSHLMSPKREEGKKDSTFRCLGEGRWLFRKLSSNFYIMSQREVSDRLPVISAVPGEEKHSGSFGKVLCHHSQYNCLKNCGEEDTQRVYPATCSIIENKTNREWRRRWHFLSRIRAMIAFFWRDKRMLLSWEIKP